MVWTKRQKCNWSKPFPFQDCEKEKYGLLQIASLYKYSSQPKPGKCRSNRISGGVRNSTRSTLNCRHHREEFRYIQWMGEHLMTNQCYTFADLFTPRTSALLLRNESEQLKQMAVIFYQPLIWWANSSILIQMSSCIFLF